MADEKIVNYKSRKSRSEFTVKGTPTRAYLAVSGDAATNPKVLKQIDDVRKGHERGGDRSRKSDGVYRARRLRGRCRISA